MIRRLIKWMRGTSRWSAALGRQAERIGRVRVRLESVESLPYDDPIVQKVQREASRCIQNNIRLLRLRP